MRMLDNVIDYNYYTVPQARRSNLRHRPVGLGIMGFQDALYRLHLPYARPRQSSSLTARWRPSAISPSRPRPISPPNVAATPASTARCGAGHSPTRLDAPARRAARRLPAGRRQHHAGLGVAARARAEGRHAQLEHDAIAPTATISNICGVSQSIEPTYQNLFVKSTYRRVHRGEPYSSATQGRGLWTR